MIQTLARDNLDDLLLAGVFREGGILRAEETRLDQVEKNHVIRRVAEGEGQGTKVLTTDARCLRKVEDRGGRGESQLQAQG